MPTRQSSLLFLGIFDRTHPKPKTWRAKSLKRSQSDYPQDRIFSISELIIYYDCHLSADYPVVWAASVLLVQPIQVLLKIRCLEPWKGNHFSLWSNIKIKKARSGRVWIWIWGTKVNLRLKLRLWIHRTHALCSQRRNTQLLTYLVGGIIIKNK